MRRHFANKQAADSQDSDSDDEDVNLQDDSATEEAAPLPVTSNININPQRRTSPITKEIPPTIKHQRVDSFQNNTPGISTDNSARDGDEDGDDEDDDESDDDESDSDSDSDEEVLKPVFIRKQPTIKSKSNGTPDLQHENDIRRLEKLYARSTEDTESQDEYYKAVDDNDKLNEAEARHAFIGRWLRRAYNEQLKNQREELERDHQAPEQQIAHLRPELPSLIADSFINRYPDEVSDPFQVQNMSKEIYEGLLSTLSIENEEIDLRKRKQMEEGDVEKYNKSLLPQKIQKTSDNLNIDRAIVPKWKDGAGGDADDQFIEDAISDEEEDD